MSYTERLEELVGPINSTTAREVLDNVIPSLVFRGVPLQEVIELVAQVFDACDAEYAFPHDDSEVDVRCL